MNIKEYITHHRPDKILVVYSGVVLHKSSFEDLATQTNTNIQFINSSSGARIDMLTSDLVLVPTKERNTFRAIKNRYGITNMLLDIICNKKKAITLFREWQKEHCIF